MSAGCHFTWVREEEMIFFPLFLWSFHKYFLHQLEDSVGKVKTFFHQAKSSKSSTECFQEKEHRNAG